jgi:hypothetical protein
MTKPVILRLHQDASCRHDFLKERFRNVGMTGVIVVRHEADSLTDFGEFLARHMDPILPFSMMGFNRENLDDTSFGIMVYEGLSLVYCATLDAMDFDASKPRVSMSSIGGVMCEDGLSLLCAFADCAVQTLVDSPSVESHGFRERIMSAEQEVMLSVICEEGDVYTASYLENLAFEAVTSEEETKYYMLRYQRHIDTACRDVMDDDEIAGRFFSLEF